MIMERYGNVKSLARTCRGALDIVATSQSHAEEVRSWAEVERRRFRLFTDVLGVFAKGKLSIEHRLRMNASTNYAIAQLLDAVVQNAKLHENSQRAAHQDQSGLGVRTEFSVSETSSGDNHEDNEASDSDNVGDEAPEAIVQHHGDNLDLESQLSLARLRVSKDISTLITLAALIKSQSVAQHNAKEQSHGPRHDEDPNSLKSFEASAVPALNRELNAVESQDFSNEFLKERFKDTVIQRWQRIRRWNDRANKFLAEDAQSSSDDSGDDTQSRWPVEGVYSKQKIGDSASKAGLEPGVSQKATTLAPSFNPDARLRSQAAKTSPMTTTGSSEVEIPEPRKMERRDGIVEFVCPLCRLPQRLKSTKESFKRAWEYVLSFRSWIHLTVT